MSYDFDPYAILGVSNDASPTEIKQAFDDLSDRLHPAHNAHQAAAKQFEMVSDAYALLADPVSRQNFDRTHKPPPEDRFSLRVMSSKRAVRVMQEEQVIYLLAEVYGSAKAVSQNQTKSSSNLNLTLVLDQSTSMADERRMDKVRAAAAAVINSLSDRDTLSVVAFNDRAKVIIPATRVIDKNELRVQLSQLQPAGSTEMYKGLAEGVKQTQVYLDPNRINHMLLLTDGHTYTDEQKCIALAQKAALQGISISAMGLGTDWNDVFLDQLASITGGTSAYIKSVNMVTRFLDDQVRNLTDIFAERMQLSIAPDADVRLEMAFKIAPSAQPLPHDTGTIPLGSMIATRPIRVLIQLMLPNELKPGYRSIARLQASGDIMLDKARPHQSVASLSIDIAHNPAFDDGPPVDIVDALAKLSLYRLQERAQTAIEQGNIQEATRALEKLGTRLLEQGESELAQQTLREAQAIARTQAFSNEHAKKTIKYGTRSLIGTESMKDV